MDEAFWVLDRLIELESEELEWPLLKANMHIYNDNHTSVCELLKEILKKESLRMEVFHGFVMATSLKSWGGGEKDKADKKFDKFLRLVPKDHPYKEYFEDNMFPTKLFSQKLESGFSRGASMYRGVTRSHRPTTT
ncbi:hypothetical protein JHK87_001324 [Glycine soja]|nr:hypothetical protein JHK87_001324 [Glycine soja]